MERKHFRQRLCKDPVAEEPGAWEEQKELSFQPASCTFLPWDTSLPAWFHPCLLEASPFFKAKFKCLLSQEVFHGTPFSHSSGGNDLSSL